MLIKHISNTNPMGTAQGQAVKLEAQQTKRRTVANVVDYCYCNECRYYEDVFALAGGEDWQNDKASFLFQKFIASDTVTIKLYKNDIQIATISDNTWGTYYSSFTAQPLYVGFILDFQKVLAHMSGGRGIYQIKAETVIYGSVSIFESQYFRLNQYSVELADQTVRIETYNTGNIMNSEFDYTGLLVNGWYQSIRIRGKLQKNAPKFIDSNYITQTYEYKQIQTKIQNEYTLHTNLLPSFLSDKIIYDNLLSNKFIISDYNIFNSDVLRKVELYPMEISEKKSYSVNRNSIFSIKFTDKKENIIKTNF